MTATRSFALAVSGLVIAGLIVPTTAEAAQSRAKNYYDNCTVKADDTLELEWAEPTLQPTDIVATPSLTTAGAIDVEWTIPPTPPAEQGGTTLRCFVIQWRATDKSETNFIGSIKVGRGLSDGDQQRYTLTGLTPGKDYKIKVAPLSSVIGEWGWANLTEWGRPTPVRAYAAPSAPAITVTLDGRSADIWWTEPEDFGGADALAGYTVEMKAGTKPWTAICDSGQGLVDLADQGSPCTKGGLTWGTDYRFRVSATSDIADGEGLMSEWSTSEVVTPATKPEAPAEPDVEINGKKVIVTWDAPDDRGAPLQKYDVIWSVKGGGGQSNQEVTNPDKTTFTTPSLTAGKVYVFTVRAKNRHGWSDESAPAEVPIVDVPGPVTSLTARADDRSVALAWRAPTDKGDSSGRITGYRIEVSTDRGKSWDTVKESVNSTSFVVGKLTNGETYQFQVSALLSYQVRGKGGKSTTYELVGEPSLTKGVMPFTGPTEPRNLATRLGDRSITVTWETPRDLGGTALKKWIIEQSDNGGRSWTKVNAPAKSATTVTISGLIIGRDYQFRIAAVTEGDGSEMTGPTARSTEIKADGLPGKPTPTVTSTVAKKISASWTKPAGGSVTSTTVRVRLVGTSSWNTFTLPGGATTWVSGSAFASTRSYEVQVQFANAIGSGEWSSISTVKVK